VKEMNPLKNYLENMKQKAMLGFHEMSSIYYNMTHQTLAKSKSD